jgi:ribosomal protein S20
MINKLRKLSPAKTNLLLLLSLQLIVFGVGWFNNWWTKESSKLDNNISKIYTDLNQQFQAIEELPNAVEKNSKIQKFTYQLILGPLAQNPEIESTKQWKELNDFWIKNNLNEIEEINVEQKILRLTQAISNFNLYTQEKRYPTLTRVSSRMKARDISLSDIKSQDAALFAFTKDIEFMQATIRTANIEEQLKVDANNRINELNTLTVDLQSDIKKTLQSQMVSKNLASKVKSLLVVAKPLVVNSANNNGLTFHGLFYGFIVIFLLSIFLGAWLVISETKAASTLKARWENDFLMLMNESFVKGDKTSANSFTKNFNTTFFQIHNYIQKKMQYGQMFQDTIPFPTILIDSNLQVRWFNQSLVSEWQLEDFIRDRESLSWEHFSQLTNMSSTDPVMDVIRNRHAGIFKLQVKPQESDLAVPYQMYVTPYQIGDEKLCLMFFYPLLSLEETIEMQTQSVIGPVRATLEAMLEDRFDSKFAEQAKSDYEVGAIDELYDLFGALHKKNTRATDELLTQLSDREIKLQDQQQVIQSIDYDVEQLKRVQNEMKQSMQHFKDHIVSSFEMMDIAKHRSEEFYQSFQQHWDRFIKLQVSAEKLFSTYQCTREQVQQIIQLRASTKEVREAIQGHKSNAHKVIKAISAFIDKQSQSRNPLYNTWNSTITELSKLPDFLTALDRYIQHTEMTLGKIVMKMEDSYKAIDDIKLDQPTANLVTSFSAVGSSFVEIEDLKEHLINSLKEFYGLMQQQVKLVTQSHEHLYSGNSPISFDNDQHGHLESSQRH